ncbi:cupin domain-containing protein [Candidatus Latescibacterota bacterium]
MFRKSVLLTVILVLILTPAAFAQRNRGVDGRAIDSYFGNWRESMPGFIHGGIITRDILTKGDPLNPPYKGAVLKYTNAFVYGSLDTGASTVPEALDGEQEIYYIISGTGEFVAGGETAQLYPGIAVLMPANLEFSMKNTGTEPITMYIVTEPIPEGFRPNKKMLVKDVNTLPIDSTTGHWVHIVKYIFVTEDGLGTLERILTVAFDPLTIGDQHFHGEGTEEVWTALSGTSLAFMGRQLRKQPPGTAYMIPPDGATTHSNLNPGEEQIKIFYFARYRDHEVRK